MNNHARHQKSTYVRPDRTSNIYVASFESFEHFKNFLNCCWEYNVVSAGIPVQQVNTPPSFDPKFLLM